MDKLNAYVYRTSARGSVASRVGRPRNFARYSLVLTRYPQLNVRRSMTTAEKRWHSVDHVNFGKVSLGQVEIYSSIRIIVLRDRCPESLGSGFGYRFECHAGTLACTAKGCKFRFILIVPRKKKGGRQKTKDKGWV